MSALELQGVTLAIAGRHLLGPISVDVAPGQIASLRGPSGVGKSSLLAYVCGALSSGIKGTGRVLLNGEDVTDVPIERRGIGILFQDDLLFAHLSVAGNLAFGLRKINRSIADRRKMIDDALDVVGMPGYAARDPATLSGGQRARVSLLRVLLSHPRALLLDEPFAHLDPETRLSVRQLVFGQVRSLSLPTILVTHDDEDMLAAAGACIDLVPHSQGRTC